MLKLLDNKNITILLSIIWGFGLSCIFRKVCKERDCLKFKAPDPNSIINKIWRENDKCYKFKIKNTTCSKNAIL